jgi:hypothetical protein
MSTDALDTTDLENNGDGKRSFSVSLPLDRDNFFRRTCPSCGLDFKTRPDDADLSWLLAKEVDRASDFIESNAPDDTELPQIRCPYCQTSSAVAELHTSETLEYIRRFAFREIVLPMFRSVFSGIGSSSNRPRGGFLSLSISYSPGVTPVRPLSGPEPADMSIVELLCCGEELKVIDSFLISLEQCPFCETRVSLALD